MAISFPSTVRSAIANSAFHGFVGNFSNSPQFPPRAQIEGRRDSSQEAATIAWIERVAAERCPSKTDVGEWLRDGVVLCKYVTESHSTPSGS